MICRTVQEESYAQSMREIGAVSGLEEATRATSSKRKISSFLLPCVDNSENHYAVAYRARTWTNL